MTDTLLVVVLSADIDASPTTGKGLNMLLLENILQGARQIPESDIERHAPQSDPPNGSVFAVDLEEPTIKALFALGRQRAEAAHKLLAAMGFQRIALSAMSDTNAEAAEKLIKLLKEIENHTSKANLEVGLIKHIFDCEVLNKYGHRIPEGSNALMLSRGWKLFGYKQERSESGLTIAIISGISGVDPTQKPQKLH